MNKQKLILFISGVIVFIGIGLYLGLPKDQNIPENEEKKLETSSNNKPESVREPASIKPQETNQTDSSKKNKLSYKEELFNDPVVKSLKMRTKEIFKNYPFAEEISDWMAIGVVMDSSQKFGEIYLGTLRKLNENPDGVLMALQKEVKDLNEKDSFIRNMFLNLAHNLNVSEGQKRDFLGSEFVRKIKLDDKGNFTEDSMNITNSMALFRQHAKNDKEALEFAKEAMELNKNNPKVQKELLVRIKSYFPNIVDELERP